MPPRGKFSSMDAMLALSGTNDKAEMKQLLCLFLTNTELA